MFFNVPAGESSSGVNIVLARCDPNGVLTKELARDFTTQLYSNANTDDDLTKMRHHKP